MVRAKWTRLVTSCCATAIVGACTGVIDSGAEAEEPWYESGEVLPGVDPISDDPTAPTFVYDFVDPSPRTGVRLLTERELNARMQALYADVSLSNVSFGGLVHGLPNIADNNSISNVQSMNALYDASLEAAEQNTENLLPCTAECTDEELETFLEALFMRPPEAEDIAQARAVYDAARKNGDVVFARRATVQARLLSPHVLYRFEHKLPEGDLYQLAQKLSFFLTGLPPDTDLLIAAKSGALADNATYVAEVDRLIASEAFASHLTYLVELWLGTTEARVDNKTPAASDSLLADMRAEFAAMVEDIAITDDGTLQELLTASSSRMSQPLAEHYDLQWPGGEGMQSIDLSATERRGLLTTALVLTANSKESGRSPMRRGAFLVHNLTCSEFGKEAGIPAMALSPPGPDQTFRDTFTPLESSAPCSNCHRLLNAGFGFDVFDVLGRRVPEDSIGLEETLGRFDLPPFEPIDFASPSEAATQFATHPAVARCFLTQVWRYAEGRDPGVTDARTFSSLIEHFEADPRPVDLIRTIALSRFFRFAEDAL